MSGQTIALNRKLDLQEAQRTSDGAGGYTETWVSLGTVWGALRAGTGKESNQDFVTVSQVPYRIVLRSAPEGASSRPKPEQRLVEAGGRIFRILAVADHDPRGLYLVCHVREEVAS